MKHNIRSILISTIVLFFFELSIGLCQSRIDYHALVSKPRRFKRHNLTVYAKTFKDSVYIDSTVFYKEHRLTLEFDKLYRMEYYVSDTLEQIVEFNTSIPDSLKKNEDSWYHSLGLLRIIELPTLYENGDKEVIVYHIYYDKGGWERFAYGKSTYFMVYKGTKSK